MQLDAILFDLDGTLLPMDQDTFTKGYFQELARALAFLDMEPEKLVEAVWAGTKAMVKNTGEVSNDTVFWQVFSRFSGRDAAPFRAASDRFYTHEFHNARKFTGDNSLAREAVALARTKAKAVILATNPLFPMAGQATRLSWIGLTPADFDLVTSYESDSFCKPNPLYYRSICQRMGLSPENCLMIGNDDTEDMYAAAEPGMACYLVTDCRIPHPTRPWQGPMGSFVEMLDHLRQL